MSYFEVRVSAEVARGSGSRRRTIKLSASRSETIEFSRVPKVVDYCPDEIKNDRHLVVTEIADKEVAGRPVLKLKPEWVQDSQPAKGKK